MSLCQSGHAITLEVLCGGRETLEGAILCSLHLLLVPKGPTVASQYKGRVYGMVETFSVHMYFYSKSFAQNRSHLPNTVVEKWSKTLLSDDNM